MSTKTSDGSSDPGPANELSLGCMIDRIARATAAYPYKVWGFGESIAMEGLLAAGGEHHAVAARLVDGWACERGPLAADPLAHVAPGVPLLERFRETGEPRLLARARELGDVLTSTGIGSHGARIHRPDLSGWEHEVWVDCMHLDGPFLARLAVVTGDDRWRVLAAEVLLSHARVLQDDRGGLFSHGFDDAGGQPNGVFWGRGQGWAMLGLVDTIPLLPPGPGRAEAEQRVRALVDGLAATAVETATGFAWHTVVDHPETYVEPSIAAFVALGVGRGLRAGLLDGRHAALADRAWAEVVAGLDADGRLIGVSDATPVGADADRYRARGRGVFPWGQGPALLAAIAVRPMSAPGGDQING